MTPEQLLTLMDRQLQGSITEQEQGLLQAYVQQDQHKEAVTEALATLLAGQQPDAVYQEERFDPLLSDLLKADKHTNKVIRLNTRRRTWWTAAAVLLVMIGAGLYFLNKGGKDQASSDLAVVQNHDALPGQEGAILTLSDGRKVVLDSAGNGTIAGDAGAKVILSNGELSYETAEKSTVTTVYNTMSTPRGRQFKLVLPDGTKVWLNAASSISYPISFEAEVRKVDITGEVYFEVAKDANKPFRVGMPQDMEVEVLGTQFNVNTHDDGAGTLTTLLEGTVKMNSAAGEVMLKPGQQAQVNRGKLQVNKSVNLEEVMAWKEGMFNFNEATFPVVMGQLKRWYDVEVEYAGLVPEGRLTGEFQRNLKLSEVLHILELSGLHSKIENKKLIVLDK